MDLIAGADPKDAPSRPQAFVPPPPHRTEHRYRNIFAIYKDRQNEVRRRNVDYFVYDVGDSRGWGGPKNRTRRTRSTTRSTLQFRVSDGANFPDRCHL